MPRFLNKTFQDMFCSIDHLRDNACKIVDSPNKFLCKRDKKIGSIQHNTLLQPSYRSWYLMAHPPSHRTLPPWCNLPSNTTIKDIYGNSTTIPIRVEMFDKFIFHNLSIGTKCYSGREPQCVGTGDFNNCVVDWRLCFLQSFLL